MSCAHPIPVYLKNSHFISTSVLDHYIPCGRCLNCRVDKQNELAHRCEYELINYKSGAFVTVTYDDYHILNKMRRNKNNELVATLSKIDCKKFLDRLNHNIKNRLPDNLLSNHHYKYLVVGEYGGDGQIFDRPHFHFLFFGLDFAYCKREFERAWQGQGMIKVLPILNGGIRYVLKYLDKQLFGEQAKIKYDDNNLERPFQTHSLGLGSRLYYEQIDYAKKHNGCYRWKGKDIPVPTYYKNKYLIKSQRILEWIKTRNDFNRDYKCNLVTRYDLHNFKINNALLREKNLNNINRLHGKPMFDYNSLNDLKKWSREYIQQLAQSALIPPF